MLTRVYMYMYIHPHAYTYMHASMRTRKHAFTQHIITRTGGYVQTPAHSLINTHTHTHTFKHTQIYTYRYQTRKQRDASGQHISFFKNHVHTAILYIAVSEDNIAEQLCILLCNTAYHCAHTHAYHTHLHTHTHTRMQARTFTHTHAHPHPYPNTYHARAKKRVCVLTW